MIGLCSCFDCFKVANMKTPARRRRITVIASQEGVAIAERSLSRLSFDTKSHFAKAQLMGKSTVDKFFNQKGIQLDSFKRICEGLELDWKEILEQDLIASQDDLKNPIALGQLEPSVSSLYRTGAPLQTASRQITIDGEESQESKLVIVLEGDIDSINNTIQHIIETFLRNRFGGTIKITNIQPGSIRITVQGDKKDIAKLVDRFTSGELTEVSGRAVEEIQVLSQEFLEKVEEQTSLDKWELVQEIVSHRMSDRQLVGVDLSDADFSNTSLTLANLSNASLSGADLSDARFSGANLSGADLSGANLSGANLSGTKFSGAKFSHANLSGADLSGADLRNANLRNANLCRVSKVANAQLGRGLGLSEGEKLDLAQRGGIFDETPGGRSPTFSPSPVRH
jgi:uncharacterized protein YjbI with pentapeptide repeats/DNA-binding Xre family transcriptional regulator